MSIPNEHKQNIISSGLHFIKAITECYGTDNGMHLWEQIASVLDPSVKGEIFFAMLTGEYDSKIYLRGKSFHYNKILTIKAMRAYDTRRLNLKEAKDLSDQLELEQLVVIEVDSKLKREAIQNFEMAGCVTT